jgi:septal ring factor EnvC (AmiA/AmiB activator)
VNIEFNQILTFVSVVAAVYFAFKSNSRANNDEVSKKAQVDAILSQKLDSISDDTKEIRKEITDVKVKVNDLSERVVMVEQSTKSAHNRLDRYEEEEIYHGKLRKRWWV